MTDIKPNKISFREFLTRIFVSNSGISSRRVLAFVFSAVLIIESFMNYDFKTLQLFAVVVLVLLGLTTFSSYSQKPVEEQKPKEDEK